jgi:TIR domain
MLYTSVEPRQLEVDRPVDLAVRLVNAGIGPCTNMVFRLELPVQVRLLRGNTLIRRTQLDAGASASCMLRVRPRQVGTWRLTSPNFSYLDPQGGFHEVEDWSLDLRVVPATSAPTAEPEPGQIGSDPSDPSTLNVFLCHSSSDKPPVRALHAKLLRDGIAPWLDELDILPGQDWDSEIRKAIRKCHIVLVCLSRASINKVGYLQKEIRHVLDVADEQPEGTIFLVPVRLEECEVPDRLSRWQWVDLFRESGYGRLMLALAARHRELNR